MKIKNPWSLAFSNEVGRRLAFRILIFVSLCISSAASAKEESWRMNDGTVAIKQGTRTGFNNTSEMVEVSFTNASERLIEVKIVAGDTVLGGSRDTVQWRLSPQETVTRPYQVFKTRRAVFEVFYRRPEF